MTEPEPRDELTLRYHEASAQDYRRPSERVREAVHAHARVLAAANVHATERTSVQVPAANQSRWKVSMFASVLLAGLAGLLVSQFDRGTPPEKELVRGAPVSVAMAPPASPMPLPESTLEKDKGVDAGSGAVAPKPNGAMEIPSARARTRPAVAPAELSSAKRSAPEPFPATQPTDARAESAPRQDADTTPPSSGRIAMKAAPAAPNTLAPAPAPAPARAGLAAPSPAPAMEAQTGTRPSNRSATLADTPVQMDSEAVPLQAPRLGALARNVQGPASALHEAARSGRMPELERQLTSGTTQLNAPDAAGRTPLMLAAIAGHADAVQRMLAAGANRALVDHEGLNALQHAKRLGRERIAAMLEAGP